MWTNLWQIIRNTWYVQIVKRWQTSPDIWLRFAELNQICQIWRKDWHFFDAFEFGAVQKYIDLVDLKPCGNMSTSICLRKVDFDTAEKQPSKITFLHILIPQTLPCKCHISRASFRGMSTLIKPNCFNYDMWLALREVCRMRNQNKFDRTVYVS